MRRVTCPRHRGLSLIEVLVGLAIVGVALVPLLGYFSTLNMSGEAEEGDTEAITLASNIMEVLISPTVSFDAIRPAGDGTPPTAGLTRSILNVRQAGFTSDRWERLISDEFVNGDRVKKSRKGLAYKIYFFAGIYFDRNNVPGAAADQVNDGATSTTASIPDAASELTFSFIPGPYGDRAASNFWSQDPAVAAAANNAKVLPASPERVNGTDGLTPLPYTLGCFQKSATGWAAASGAATWAYHDKDNYQRIPGWPRSPVGTYVMRGPAVDNRPALREQLFNVATRRTAPTWGYHPVTFDQGKFITAARGALMKVVVGVKYQPYNFRVSGSPSAEQEFWLVSLKARLDE